MSKRKHTKVITCPICRGGGKTPHSTAECFNCSGKRKVEVVNEPPCGHKSNPSGVCTISRCPYSK